MGCDIHAYIEFRDGDRWSGFAGRVNPGRNYKVFGILAGVRTDGPPVIQPRGVPPDMSWQTNDDFHLHVVENDKEVWEGAVARATAEEWVKSGASQWHVDGRRVTHPDWHTASWLTLPEYEAALQRFTDTEPEYRAVAAAMRELELCGCVTRLVFWFDN